MVSNNLDDILPAPSLRKVQVPNFGSPKDEQYTVLQNATKPHVESYNFAIKEALPFITQDIQPLEIGLPNGDRLKVQLLSCSIQNPAIKRNAVARNFKMYPAECRSRGVTYRGECQIMLSWSLNGVIQEVIEKIIGEVPVMLKSHLCNLHNLKPKKLIEVGEEENEMGGYFIVNGLEKIIRMLIAARRNYPIAMQRNGWKNKGDLFTEYGVSIRCVRPDQSGNNMVLHYLSDGTVKVMILFKKEIFYVPLMLILKALLNETDCFISKCLTKGKEDDSFLRGCVSNMILENTSKGILTQEQALNYIGDIFRIVRLGLPSWYTNAEIAAFLLKKCVCVHLENDKEKFDLMVHMTQKLFAVVKNECALESPDNPMNHELLLSGQLFLIVLKEKIYGWLNSLRYIIEKKIKASSSANISKAIMRDSVSRNNDITRGVENFLATGNFVPVYEGSLMQFSGLTVIADKLNFWRYLSHFRAVHRGAFFAQMRTTTVRKLLPEAWGYLCPVHTPDGTPCGLLNHMAFGCQVVNVQPDSTHLFNLLCKYGLMPVDDPITMASDSYIVLLDGKMVGRIMDKMSLGFVTKLRSLKCFGKENVPETIEICFIPRSRHASQYPGLYIFTNPCRFMRPVKNLLTGTTELLGSMEQVYLHIALKEEDVVEGETFHMEITPLNILSMLANQIPYSDFNQSPRNMYECQMGKQTMGTPCHALHYRSDNKLYQICTPQSPIVRPRMHDYYQMDDYPLGTNAIVAVISYTGYDMEDAIILNKSSVERGFKHGCIYKTEKVNLRTIAGDKGLQKSLSFGRKKDDDKWSNFLDTDGLPYIGTRLNNGDPICSYFNERGEVQIMKYKSIEEAYVHDVKVLGNDTGTDTNQQISIKYRIPRNPIIGDKFASRHGQKGICSMKLHVENMPFTESGMTPDIIFNPHGFPSRMTIGMMIESMAGKSAAMQGILHDATPFQFSETDTALEYFGKCLQQAGYDYYGTERMYSGVDGRELEADIFFGVVYYQRLRHMVSDKFQVRTTGPIDSLTRQPVKGRKRDGGIRFGEMERDSLAAHGSSVLVSDRLFTCSDATQQYVCLSCKNLLSPLFEKQECVLTSVEIKEWTCEVCKSGRNVCLVDVPYVFRYLCGELAAMNIKIKLKIGDLDEIY